MAKSDIHALEVPGLEGVRLLSAVSVVFIHATLFSEPLRHGGAPGSWLARSAYLAVDVLFVVSGFAQFLPMAAKGPDHLPPWRSYAVRRLARIVPTYWLACAATALYIGRFSWGWGVPGKSVGLWEVLIHLAFLNQMVFGAAGRNGFGPNQAMWTMTVEAMFYLCLPLVARRFLRHPIVGLFAAAAIASGWRLLAYSYGQPFGPAAFISQTPAFAFHFAIGMAAAMLVVRLRAFRAENPELAARIRSGALGVLVWSVVAIAAWLRAADPLHHQYSPAFLNDSRWVWNMAFAIPVGMLLTSLPFAPSWSIWPISNRVAKWAGEGTYGTYLFHTLVLLIAAQKWHDLGHAPLALWQIGGLAAAESLLLGRLSFLVVEEPIRRAAKRVAARLEGRTVNRPRPQPALIAVNRAREASDAV